VQSGQPSGGNDKRGRSETEARAPKEPAAR